MAATGRSVGGMRVVHGEHRLEPHLVRGDAEEGADPAGVPGRDRVQAEE